MTTPEQLNADIERLGKTALRIKKQRDVLAHAAREYVELMKHDTILEKEIAAMDKLNAAIAEAENG